MTNHAQPHQHLNKNEIVHVVQQMVDAATKAILPHFRMGRVLTENKDKHGFDPVTVADRDAEQAMRAVLSRLRPLDGILGEEFGETSSHNGLPTKSKAVVTDGGIIELKKALSDHKPVWAEIVFE